MKKIMATLLALFLLLIGGSALAEGEGVWFYTDTSYSAYVEGELTGDVVIPANVNEYAVNALLYSALSQQHGITSLTMPETLYALQNASVAYMDNLQAVALNDGLEVIARGNFAYLPSLTSLTIPASVRVIEDSISSCDNLREIYFEGVCPVFVNADYCFSWLPDDYVIYVPDDQFDAYAEALKDTGDAVDHLQPSGQNAIIPEGAHEEWFVFDETTGTITGYNEYHAYVEIPASIGGVPVQAIGENAMSLDYYLYALIIPEGIERIETAAFHSDTNLVYVDLPSTLKTIGDEAFFNAQISRVDWSEGLEEIGAQAFQYHHESVLTLPSTLKTIGASAFEDAWCSELYLSGDLQSIGSRAFADTFLSYMAFDFYAPIEIAEDAFADNNIADLDLPWDSSFKNRAQYAEILRDQCPDCTVWINNPIAAAWRRTPWRT